MSEIAPTNDDETVDKSFTKIIDVPQEGTQSIEYLELGILELHWEERYSTENIIAHWRANEYYLDQVDKADNEEFAAPFVKRYDRVRKQVREFANDWIEKKLLESANRISIFGQTFDAFRNLRAWWQRQANPSTEICQAIGQICYVEWDGLGVFTQTVELNLLETYNWRYWDEAKVDRAAHCKKGSGSPRKTSIEKIITRCKGQIVKTFMRGKQNLSIGVKRPPDSLSRVDGKVVRKKKNDKLVIRHKK